MAEPRRLDAPTGTRIGAGRAVGIDLGERRIGVATSDGGRVLARPHSVITRSGTTARDHDAIAAVVVELEAVVVVVGLPLSLSGGLGPAARKAVEETEILRQRLAVPVIAFDERLTTVEATRRLREGSAQKRRAPAPRRRAVVDDVAAAVLLQAWIDTDRPFPTGSP